MQPPKVLDMEESVQGGVALQGLSVETLRAALDGELKPI